MQVQVQIHDLDLPGNANLPIIRGSDLEQEKELNRKVVEGELSRFEHDGNKYYCVINKLSKIRGFAFDDMKVTKYNRKPNSSFLKISFELSKRFNQNTDNEIIVLFGKRFIQICLFKSETDPNKHILLPEDKIIVEATSADITLYSKLDSNNMSLSKYKYITDIFNILQDLVVDRIDLCNTENEKENNYENLD